MLTTLKYDDEKHLILPATKVWSDFTVNLPLIRSFSIGGNFDKFIAGRSPEYPVFPGEPIKYHYLFFFVVGMLEKLGMRIDWALNIPSILGFFLLGSMIYLFSKKVFKSRLVGLLSVIFFLFNGAFAFIDFFKTNPISLNTFVDITSNNRFWGLAPWAEGNIASSMWNLNIYTNQRHLALALGFVLLFMYTALLLESRPWKKQIPLALLWGTTLGFFPYFHQPALLIVAVVMVCYWLAITSLRRYLFLIGAISVMLILPQVAGIQHGSAVANWRPGFIIRPPLNFANIVSFWWQNFGFHMVLIPFGFILLGWRQKRYFIPIFFVFLIGSLFTFSPDPATNHKFFNFVQILGGMLTAYVVALFLRCTILSKKLAFKIIGGFSGILLVLFLTLSGIMDYFAVINDVWIPMPDVNAHPVTRWLVDNTSKDGLLLNSSFFAPYPLSGRSIFLGWPYFSWSAGYNVNIRQSELKNFLETDSQIEQCVLVQKYGIDYVILEYPPQEPKEFIPNYSTFKIHGSPVFESDYNGVTFSIYDAKSYCAIKK